MLPRVLPECWGHRGASAALPENTIASFEVAIKDGSHGIESDIHVSKDSQLIMFHDQDLFRTTGSKGLIRERNWYGEDGIEHLRTIREPHLKIPTFAETVALLLKPEHKHVKFDVDVKVYNDPNRLFSLMHKVVAAQPNWETELAPRILLGLWHPSFVEPAIQHVPYLRRSHIGISPHIARTYFWDGVEAFSMNFGALCTMEGERFRAECKAAGKQVFVWTVNDPAQMMEAVRWGVDAIITDVPKVWLDLRKELDADFEKGSAPYESTFGRLRLLWGTPMHSTPMQMVMWGMQKSSLEKQAGEMRVPKVAISA